MKTKSILLTYDVSDDSPQGSRRFQTVRDLAYVLASKLNSPIELIYVEELTLYHVSNPYYRAIIRDLVSERKKKLNKTALSFKVPVKISFLGGYAKEKIAEITSKKNIYELVALGSHGHKGFKRALLGSVAEEVVRNSKIPVLVVGPIAEVHFQKSSTRFLNKNTPRLLVATDLSQNAKMAEDYALSLAQRLSAEVILIHALVTGFHLTFGSAFTMSSAQSLLQNLVQELRPSAISELQRRQKKFKKKGVECSIWIDEEKIDASSAILNYAKKVNPTAIIMGTRGRSLLVSSFLGSTARQMILNSPNPVIVVPVG